MENNKNNVDSRIETGTIVYIGRRTLRHKEELELDAEEMLKVNPEARPHVFVDYGNAKLMDVLIHAGGKQGVMVDTQKIVRNKHTLAEVKAWRASFTREMLNGQGEEIVKEDEPFVILNFATAGTKLDVPVQPIDCLNAIKKMTPEIYELVIQPIEDEDERLAKAVQVYGMMSNIKSS